ncbi:MAG: hypothetical protein CMO41_04500 [Verrucomicrobiales bacterium]|nr:hypothetical protein [Verrucomicrobiales bacterium]|tara:strand:- start:5994 stop:6233 length:240 start_codon:yes stop_codon:yes gene_type:complete
MENLTWLAVGLVLTAYIRQRHTEAEKRKPRTVQLSAQNEVDPTRWKHDGSQPPHYGTFDGNRLHEKQAEVLELRNALAF